MNEPNEIERAAIPEGAAGSAFAVGNIVAGRYVLLTHLGGGRFGPVFETVDRALSGAGPERERRVALHAMDGAAADDVLAALERWRAAPQSWRHPNVVKLLDFGRHGATAYALTELLEGLTLRHVLDDIAPELLEADEAFAIVGKVGAALRYAHAKGVVHGDIRPETVFVTTSFGVKVLDFWPPGVTAATLYDAESPAPATASDDVYALACLAYELMTGRHPFNGNAPSEARRADLEPAPVLGLPHKRWQAIARGLALEASERTPSVAEFLAELGITGQEELPRSSQAQESRDAPIPAPPPAPPPPPRYAPAARAAPVRAMHEVQEHDTDIPTLRTPVRVRRARAVRKPRRRRSRSWVFLLPVLLVAGLAFAVLRDYDEMRGAVTDLIAASADRVGSVRETLSDRETADAGPAATAAAADAASDSGVVASADAGQAANAAESTEARAATESFTADETASRDPAVGSNGDIAETAVEVPQTSEPQPAAPPPVAIDAQPPAPPSASGAAPGRNAELRLGTATAAVPRREPVGTRAAGTMPAPDGSDRARGEDGAAGAPVAGVPAFALAEARVTAAEGDGLARVTIRHAGQSEDPVRVFWWTGGHTAQADDDFADLEGVETLEPGASRDILVPLANDVWPEDAESFFVYFGVELARRRTQMPAAQAEIVVLDDDR